MPQNFQNWMALDVPQNPSSPSGIPGTEFQDWSNIVGPSDYLKKVASVSAGAAPVAPPQNWADVAQQAIAPTQQRFGNLTNAAGQLAEGNTFNAYSAYKNRPLPTVQPVTETPAQQEQSGFNFSRH